MMYVCVCVCVCVGIAGHVREDGPFITCPEVLDRLVVVGYSLFLFVFLSSSLPPYVLRVCVCSLLACGLITYVCAHCLHVGSLLTFAIFSIHL